MLTAFQAEALSALQSELHEREAHNIDLVTRQLNEEKSRVVAALNATHETKLAALSLEVDSGRQRGLLDHNCDCRLMNNRNN